MCLSIKNNFKRWEESIAKWYYIIGFINGKCLHLFFKSWALAKHLQKKKKKLASKNHLPYKNYTHKQDFKFNQLKAKSHWKKYKTKYNTAESIKLLSITEYTAFRMTQVYRT